VDMREPAEKRRPIRETIEDPIREFHVKTFTNREEKIVIIGLPPNVICYFDNLCG
jgi:hypothetical protein